MKTKFFPIFIAFFIVTAVFSQSNLNDYKYVIVPKKFDFLKEQDQYQLNSLAQFLFNKYGFEALFEGDDYPEDLASNRCLGLRSDVIKDSGMFKTKLNVELKDCNDRVVYTSEVGESREKEYKIAFNLALRDAFKSIEALNYKYEPSEEIMSLANPKVAAKSEVAQEIQQLKQEIQNLKKEKEAEVEVIQVEKITAEPIKKEELVKENIIEGFSNILYPQEIENGFQLVDSSPKVVYRIKKTNLNNVFLVENKSAIIYKKGDEWVIEYYTDSVLKQDVLNIKF
ncbi:hypothetical protein SAMN05428642_101115 [Flaviramulus basaltis]|uniref:Secreted protein n=1 Tax=Flaviramulus basaltis TaxID=369401 RepID=A0A1K2IAI4_9FLAO|nr:hypothetical protein [Flaviramulus basaltis]SFZ89282.1 hypothetical protein SAMN05428642_101115 [Flaviramulus basaltis]